MKKKRLLGGILFAAALALLFAVFRTVPLASLLEENILEECSAVLVKGGAWDISSTEASPEERDAVLELLSNLRVRWGGGADGIRTNRSGERLYTLTLQGLRHSQEVSLNTIWCNESGQLCIVGGGRYMGDTAQLISLLEKICDFPSPASASN